MHGLNVGLQQVSSARDSNSVSMHLAPSFLSISAGLLPSMPPFLQDQHLAVHGNGAAFLQQIIVAFA